MGNKASSLLPPLDAMLKALAPTEAQALEARFPGAAQQHHQGSSSKKAATSSIQHSSPIAPGGLVTKEQFVASLGEGLGVGVKRVLLRLFAVLDANGSGALEYKEHVAAAFFFTKATPIERNRVLFSMYESPPVSSSAATASAAGKGHLSKENMATLVAETTLALAEIQATPASVLPSSSSPLPTAPPTTSLAHIDPNAPPFKELVTVMVDVAFAKYDTDRDGRLSLPDFQAFVAQQSESGVNEVLGRILAAPQVPRVFFDSSNGKGNR